MTWTNALLIGSCALSYKLDGVSATLDDLNAAGITIDTTGGVITATWDGVTGSPTSLEVDVMPSYDISSLPARIAAVAVNSPFGGANPSGDQGFQSFSFEYSPFSDLPWVATSPYPQSYIGCFGGNA